MREKKLDENTEECRKEEAARKKKSRNKKLIEDSVKYKQKEVKNKQKSVKKIKVMRKKHLSDLERPPDMDQSLCAAAATPDSLKTILLI